MDDVEINDIGSIGVIHDVPGYMLPPEAWTTALNVYSRDNAMEVLKGWESVFGTPLYAPWFAMAVTSITQTFWLYNSLTKAAVYDGTSHVDITRASGDYTAAEGRDWNGTLLAGIPIINNGSDAPQFWSDYLTTQKLQDLSNWPVNTSCRRIIAFGAFLVAINITDSGNNFPHLVSWSSETPGPGQLPVTWDVSDETEDAGEYDLPDVNSGILQDALTLGTKLFLYKDQSMWSMRFIGGRAVFAFDNFSETMGILAPRCVAITGDGKKHVVATQDDIIIHDGVSPPTSIINKRMRRKIFNDLDTTNYINSFMFSDPENNLIVFCYPTSGETYPNMALVYNYKDNSVTEMDGVTFRGANVGRVESTDSETWDAAVGTWDSDDAPWSLSERRKLVLFDPTNTLLYKWQSSYQRNGLDYSCNLQRTGLSVIGKKRDGTPIVNHDIYKYVDGIHPKIRSSSTTQIRIGFQDVVNGPITWSSYVDFDPSTQTRADLTGSGRAVAVEYNLPTASDWKLDGYRIRLEADGEH